MSFCSKCDNPVSEGEQFCAYCGAEQRYCSNAGANNAFYSATDISCKPAHDLQRKGDGYSAFHPAANFGIETVTEQQPKSNEVSSTSNIADSAADADRQRLPSQRSRSNTILKNDTPNDGVIAAKNTKENLSGGSSAPKKKKSHEKQILISTACLATVACIALALIFILPIMKPTTATLGSDPIKLNEEVMSLLKEYTNENGYVSMEDCETVGRIVRDYAVNLKQKGEIQDYAFDEDSGSVSFLLNDNILYIYNPPIENTLSEDDEFSVMAISTFNSWYAAIYETVDIPVHGKFGGPKNSAKYIYDHCDQCTMFDNIREGHCSPEELKEKLGTIRETNTRAVFFFGHGGLLPLPSGESWSIFRIGGEPFSQDQEKYKDMLEAHELVLRSNTSPSGLCYAITPKFIEKYMDKVDGGLFFAGACNSAADDGTMARAFINKGFDCYMGSSNTITTTYCTSIMKCIAIYLTENENGKFTDIHSALEKAEQECGTTDKNGTKILCIDEDSNNPFRLCGDRKTESTETNSIPTDTNYEKARSIYQDYFRNIDLESLRVPFSPYSDATVQVFDFGRHNKDDYTIQSMLADIGDDGSYELLLSVENSKLIQICYLLFAIHDGKVEQVVSSYVSGGTFGGEYLSVAYDISTKGHVLTKRSSFGYGAAGGSSGLTAYACTNQKFTESVVLTCTVIMDNPFGDKKGADKLRAGNPYILEIDGGVKSYTLNDSYISEEEYEKQSERFIGSTEDRFQWKDVTLENMVP